MYLQICIYLYTFMYKYIKMHYLKEEIALLYWN